jgi:tRNA threonylcarbamoyladenosine biosynthesis protein TsaE
VVENLIKRWQTDSEIATEQIGNQLAKVLQKGAVVLLNGELGAGKTVLARGIVRGMGGDEPYVTSPTFTLMNSYTQGRLPVYHFDLYRLALPDELGLTGTDEYLEGGGVALVEWAIRALDWIPADHLIVDLYHHNDNQDLRTIEMRAVGPRSREMFNAFCQSYPD